MNGKLQTNTRMSIHKYLYSSEETQFKTFYQSQRLDMWKNVEHLSTKYLSTYSNKTIAVVNNVD